MEDRLGDWLPGFFRCPSWRLLRADYVHKSGVVLDSGIDDAGVRRALRFFAAGVLRESKAWKRLLRLDPALLAAMDLAEEKNSQRLWRLEALLLTNLSLGEIAWKCSLPAEVIEAFHDIFFDVRPNLRASDWILTQAIGTTWWQGFAGLPLGVLWKYAAYTAGPRALEVTIAVTTDQPLPGWLRTSFPANSSHAEDFFRQRAKLTVAAMTATSLDELISIVTARRRLLKQNFELAANGGRSDGLLPLMEKFLQSLGSRKRPTRKLAGNTERSKSDERPLEDEKKTTKRDMQGILTD